MFKKHLSEILKSVGDLLSMKVKTGNAPKSEFRWVLTGFPPSNTKFSMLSDSEAILAAAEKRRRRNNMNYDGGTSRKGWSS